MRAHEALLPQQTGRSHGARALQFGGYEFNRTGVQFSMMDGAKEIQCAVAWSVHSPTLTLRAKVTERTKADLPSPLARRYPICF